jgi:prepilin-type processing-associated H-X9-DG protein
MKRKPKIGDVLAIGFILLVTLAILYPVRVGNGHAPATACIYNLKQAMMGSLIYASEHDDRLPISTSWMDDLHDYTKNQDIYGCPQIKDRAKGEYGHAMNIATSTLDTNKVKQPAAVACLFDSVLLARNACSGFSGFPDPKVRATNVSYVDGHARRKEMTKK